MNPSYGKEDTVAVRNAVGGFELLIDLFNQELHNFRGGIRNFGQQIRTFLQENVRWKTHYTDALIEFAAKADKEVYIEYEKLKCSSKGNNFEKELVYTLPTRTFNDVEEVLLTDDVVEGIVLSSMLKCPKWKCLPERVIVPRDFSVCSEFQLWNRPLSMTADEEEERLSLPSTRCTDWEKDKITSVEAQLAMLTRQMQLLLQVQQQQSIASRGATPTQSARSSSPSDSSSEDEGRGASLCSPATTLKKSPNTLATVAPPPGPPPPPPPPNLLASIENKIVVVKADRPLMEEEPRSSLPNRPTISDLRAVQLRKVDAARSPGGTPQNKSRLRNGEQVDQGGLLAAALKDKFRTLQNSFSEQEDGDSTWADED